MATYGASSKGTRHIHRRWHFTKFHTDAGEIYICAIKGVNNPVNCMTKLVVGNPPAKLFRNFLKTEIENQKRRSCDFER
jgi:hypothetical protein